MSKSKRKDISNNSGLPGLSNKEVKGYALSRLPGDDLDSITETKKGKFKRSGDFTDQLLKYRYPKDKQPSLFDSLLPETVKKIEISGTEIKEVVEGIKLTGAEQKVVDSLIKLLHENSQNTDPSKDDYYIGNSDAEIVHFGVSNTSVRTNAPQLSVTLYQLTLEYKGGEYVSGKDLKNVQSILTALGEKKFLFSYTETTTVKGSSKKIEQKIEDFLPLIKLPVYTRRILDADTDKELSKTSTILIGLNPIFQRQMEGRGIYYPEDTNRRTIIAYGSHNVSESTFRLRDWLIRRLSFKQSKAKPQEIGLERLFYLLDEKKMNESRRKLVERNTQKAIETCVKLGIIQKYEIKPDKTGGKKVVFYLNKDWQ